MGARGLGWPSGPHAAWLVRLGCSFALVVQCLVAHAATFGLDDVARRARDIASRPYKAPPDRLPQELKDLDYDAMRDIRFKPQDALWRAEKLPFELMFLHLGRGVREPVAINTIEQGRVHKVPFDPAHFDYGRNRVDPQKLRDIGFAGFRVHYAVNTPSYKDEVLVFLGASYFRALGKAQVYGVSARGLAVDTAQPEGEEFPRFSEFWIERPRRGATSLTIYALLESRRLAGAYRFVLAPGTDTVMQVSAQLFLRDPVGKLGIAPLTSMYAFGENQPGRDDYRPEVHDSDGLSIESREGEWIWRPLVNPRRLLVTSFTLDSPRGFGLMQRDRQPTSYEDPEALYERRPSVWVEPAGAWGAGRVELVQIP
jgi:glucans biosynthesis protein